MRYLVKPVRISRDRTGTPFEIDAEDHTVDGLLAALAKEMRRRIKSREFDLTIKFDLGSETSGSFSLDANRFGHGRFYAVEEDQGPRPDYCCGRCPGIVGGGYDCTCLDNPRCSVGSGS